MPNKYYYISLHQILKQPSKTIVMKTSKFLIAAAVAIASNVFCHATPEETPTPTKTHIYVKRTVSHTPTGVKRTPPRFAPIPEVWIEESYIHILSDYSIDDMGIEILDENGYSVHESVIDLESDAEALISLSSFHSGHYIIYIVISGIEFQGEFDL